MYLTTYDVTSPDIAECSDVALHALTLALKTGARVEARYSATHVRLTHAAGESSGAHTLIVSCP